MAQVVRRQRLDRIVIVVARREYFSAQKSLEHTFPTKSHELFCAANLARKCFDTTCLFIVYPNRYCVISLIDGVSTILWVLLQVLKAVANAHEQTQGVAMDALAALEKTQPFGFDYRDVSMPVHVFHGRADHMVRLRL